MTVLTAVVLTVSRVRDDTRVRESYVRGSDTFPSSFQRLSHATSFHLLPEPAQILTFSLASPFLSSPMLHHPLPILHLCHV